ncbi:MAG: hypothetical protein ACLPVF_18890 [Acidimicrobiales bacterium]
MFLSIAFDVVIAALVLYRQRRIRPVPRVLHLRLPVLLGIIGLIEILDYGDGHHVSAGAFWLVIAATVVGAGLLGFVRALTVRIWPSNNWVVRQGTWLTMALWVLSFALHLTSGFGAAHLGAAGLATSSFLLYVALTLGVQASVVHGRAAPYWDALGPEAGRRVQVTFGTGPMGAGNFFGALGDLGGFGPGGFGPGGAGTGGPSRAARADDPRHDPTIIDAEVVDDDVVDEPPSELR